LAVVVSETLLSAFIKAEEVLLPDDEDDKLDVFEDIGVDITLFI
jgi:hypothetical protein